MRTTIGANIIARRTALGWDRADLARRFDGKNPRTVIYRWEMGLVIPTPDSVIKLATILGCQPFDIDPYGEAFKKIGRRVTKPLQKRHTSADATHQAGVSMNQPGPLPAELIGAWQMLRDPQDREEFLATVREYIGQYLAKPRAHAKKARR